MPEDKLDSLKKKRDQLTARIQTLESARKSKERKEETRRKILIGAYTLDKSREEGTEEALYQNMLQYLTRETDKKLFEPLGNAHESKD